MADYHISHHKVRGQFASANCFESWLVEQTDAGRAQLITVREEPGIPPGGANDWRYYIWRQDAPVPPPKGCDYDLVKVGTQITWPSAEAALAVVEGKVQAAAKIDANVKAANEKAVSLGNIVGGAVDDAAKAAGAGLDQGIPTLVKGAVIVGGVALGVWAASKFFGGK